MLRHSHITILAAALLVVAGLAGATGGVAAQSSSSDDSFVGAFTDDDNDDWTSTFAAATKGRFAALKYEFAAIDVPGIGEDTSTSPDAASQDVQAVQEYFNNHSSEFVAYTNNRTSPSSEWNVFEVTFERSDSTETVYLVANISSDGAQYTNASIVDNTSRTVDKQATLKGYASKNAREEVEQFYTDFVKPNKSVSQSYLARMASQYGGYVDAPFLIGGDS